SESAFTIFLTLDTAAIEPLYGRYSREFGLIEAGLMAQLLEITAAGAGLGLCQAGILGERDQLRDRLGLQPSCQVLHGLLGGRPRTGAGGSPTDLAVPDAVTETSAITETSAVTEASAASGERAVSGDRLVGRLRDYLSDRLPQYLVPARFVVLE